MPRRVNIMMDDDAWRVIGKLPRGARFPSSGIHEVGNTPVRRFPAQADALLASLVESGSPLVFQSAQVRMSFTTRPATLVRRKLRPS